jgi:hypothetical protein
MPPWGTLEQQPLGRRRVAAQVVATVFGSEVPGLLHAGFAGHELMHQLQAQHVGRH